MPPWLSNSVPAGTVPVPVTVTSPRAKVAAVRSSPVLGTMYRSRSSPVRLAGSSFRFASSRSRLTWAVGMAAPASQSYVGYPMVF